MLRLAVILTLHNSIEREKAYAPRIVWWCNAAQNTSTDLYVVNSASNPLHMPCKHATVVQFDQNTHENPFGRSSTGYELLSLRHMLTEHPELSSYDVVFKITAKYILPAFLSLSLPKADLYVQGRHKGNANTEVLGIRGSILTHVLWVLPHMLPGKHCCLENMLENLMQHSDLKVHRLPRFPVPATPTRMRRGAGDLMTNLRS